MAREAHPAVGARKPQAAEERVPAFASLRMQSRFAAFVRQPCQKTFLAVRECVLRRCPLPLTTTDLSTLQRLLEEGRYQELQERLSTLPPSKVLSPRFHYLAAEAAAGLGQHDDVELERWLFVLTLRGLLATGDGTPAQPYLVCHASDEYDILSAQGLVPAGQSLREHQGRVCDVIRCTDGREVWFDVTAVVQRPAPPRKAPTRRLTARATGARRSS